MIAPQRGQAVGPVVGGVLGVADPHQGLVQEAHDDGHHVVPVHRAATKIVLDRRPQVGQGAGELEELTELVLVPDRSPARVVAVLLASPGVAAGGQEVPVAPAADPHVRPGGRDRQALDPVPDRRLDGAPAGFLVGEASASATTAVARLVVGRIDEASVGDGLEVRSMASTSAPRAASMAAVISPITGSGQYPGGGTPGLIHPVPAGRVTGWTGPRVGGEP